MDSERIRASFFFGTDKGHLQKCGDLVLDMGEWQALASAWGLGLEQMVQVVFRDDKCYVPLHIIVEGEKKALGREDELEGEPDVYEMPRIYQRKEKSDGKPDNSDA
jgi:hypothetical protein